MHQNDFRPYQDQQTKLNPADPGQISNVNEAAIKALQSFLQSPIITLNNEENLQTQTGATQGNSNQESPDKNLPNHFWFNLLHSLMQKQQPMRILSPRIFPIVQSQANLTRIASPDILSLVDEPTDAKRNDVASVSGLLRDIGFNQQETDDWMEIIRDATSISINNLEKNVPNPKTVFVFNFCLTQPTRFYRYFFQMPIGKIHSIEFSKINTKAKLKMFQKLMPEIKKYGKT